MPRPEWQIEQPPVEDMHYPVQCAHCRRIYDMGHVKVTGRYTDCTVWTAPCCGHSGVDDRPDVRHRHYRELKRDELQRIADGGSERMMVYNAFGLRRLVKRRR